MNNTERNKTFCAGIVAGVLALLPVVWGAPWYVVVADAAFVISGFCVIGPELARRIAPRLARWIDEYS